MAKYLFFLTVYFHSVISFGKPIAPQVFCDRYGDSPHCKQQVSCEFCHSIPPSLNDFGSCLKEEVQSGEFERELGAALTRVEEEDCDNDGFSNFTEFEKGSFPGIATSIPKEASQGEEECNEESCKSASSSAWIKVHRDICGITPSFALKQFFETAADEQKLEIMKEDFYECLESSYWKGKDGVLWSLGHPKIRPSSSIKSGDNGGSVPLGDYDDDYNLFVYYQMDDRDVRGILTAQHYVTRQDNPVKYLAVAEQPLHPKAGGLVKAVAKWKGTPHQQFVESHYRAGLLTTLYASVTKTMFTEIPRTAAAHAMREYIGIDIAKAEGLSRLYPKDSEFELIDYDAKGILEPACKACHMGLDAIATLWTPYNGLGRLTLEDQVIFQGTYDENRMAFLAEKYRDTAPLLGETPSTGYAWGEPVGSLPEWAHVMANSDDFARKVVTDYWLYFFGELPHEDDLLAFDSLWKNLKSKHNYSVERMLYELVFTPAFSRR